jgi:hypothetical protein
MLWIRIQIRIRKDPKLFAGSVSIFSDPDPKLGERWDPDPDPDPKKNSYGSTTMKKIVVRYR